MFLFDTSFSVLYSSIRDCKMQAYECYLCYRSEMRFKTAIPEFMMIPGLGVVEVLVTGQKMVVTRTSVGKNLIDP